MSRVLGQGELEAPTLNVHAGWQNAGSGAGGVKGGTTVHVLTCITFDRPVLKFG